MYGPKLHLYAATEADVDAELCGLCISACLSLCMGNQSEMVSGEAQQSDHTSALTRCSSIVNEHKNCRFSTARHH